MNKIKISKLYICKIKRKEKDTLGLNNGSFDFHGPHGWMPKNEVI